MTKINTQEFATLTPDQLQEKYNLSKEDLSFYTNQAKQFEYDGFIGIHKYNSLIEKKRMFQNWNFANPEKKQQELSELEKSQILQFETEKTIFDREAIKRNSDYMRNLRSSSIKTYETTKGLPLTKKVLYIAFKQVFKSYTGCDFEENEDTIQNIEPIIKYFSKDETFKNCNRLVKYINGFSEPLIPSFDKGILIIGDYGNGKSTILKCFEILINHNYKIAQKEYWDNIQEWKNARFKIANCHEVVSEFEGLSSPEEKKVFYQKYSSFRYGFDDLKKEKIASNFGLTNVIQTIIEKRYDNRFKTFGTCNYPQNEPNDLNGALFEFSTRYGGHVYDRVFQMFNIVEFKGKSFRK